MSSCDDDDDDDDDNGNDVDSSGGHDDDSDDDDDGSVGGNGRDTFLIVIDRLETSVSKFTHTHSHTPMQACGCGLLFVVHVIESIAGECWCDCTYVFQNEILLYTVVVVVVVCWNGLGHSLQLLGFICVALIGQRDISTSTT